MLDSPLNGTGVDSAAHEVGSRLLLKPTISTHACRKTRGRAGGLPKFSFKGRATRSGIKQYGSNHWFEPHQVWLLSRSLPNWFTCRTSRQGSKSNSRNRNVRILANPATRRLHSVVPEGAPHSGPREPDMVMSDVATFARTWAAENPRSGERSYRRLPNLRT